jgi:uncharacterized protein
VYLCPDHFDIVEMEYEIKNRTIVEMAVSFVKKALIGAEGGHDWQHIYRVWKLAKKIAIEEEADLFVVELAALFHDLADPKFHNGDEQLGPKMTQEFLINHQLDAGTIEHVVAIIRNVSFKNNLEKVDFTSRELMVVQDADRLDAMGAIGIARAFNYGGFKNRPLYDPEIQPKMNMSKEEYKKSTAPTINHFYEKLLLLRDLMNTKTGKRLAIERHLFMERFLFRFFEEWEGEK